MRNIILKSAVALALGIPLVASAESTLNTVGAPVTTNARVDFTIIIPRFISLQVGAAGGYQPDHLRHDRHTSQRR